MRYISSIHIAGFRCYEDDVLNLKDITILFGPNNAGKSAFLNLVRRFASANIQRHPRQPSPAGAAFYGPSNSMRLEDGDSRLGSNETRFSITFEGTVIPRILASDSIAAEHMKKAHSAINWPLTVNGVWKSTSFIDDLAVAAGSCEPGALWKSSGLQPIHIGKFAVEIAEMLPLVVIPERRAMNLPLNLRHRPSTDVVQEEVFTPDSLLPTLLEWQCTDLHRFAQAQDLASKILDQPIKVNCDPARATFHVGIAGEPQRRIQDLGSGVAEVLTLATALTSFDGGLLLYEEPELHLHPDIQKRVLDTLEDRNISATWQVLATTHSEHILARWSSPQCHCVEVYPYHSRSTLAPSPSRELLRRAIRRLGASPGSILAAATIIWVEGPSDAIYLRYFLSCAAPNLIESVDFGFAFFGGSLLKHTRMSDFTDDQIVDIFNIHPDSFVIFDSDRGSANMPLGKEYAREFSRTAIAERIWPTQGREIENYLPGAVLAWAATGRLETLVPVPLDRDFAVFSAQVSYLREYSDRSRSHRDASDENKSRFAAQAVDFMRREHIDPFTRLDLKTRIDDLVRFITDGCKTSPPAESPKATKKAHSD